MSRLRQHDLEFCRDLDHGCKDEDLPVPTLRCREEDPRDDGRAVIDKSEAVLLAGFRLV